MMKKLKGLLFAIVLFAAVLLPVFGEAPQAHASGNTYYVSPSGSDAGSGSISSPWRTLKHGSSQLAAGDTLVARGGIYTGTNIFLPLVSGKSTDPITLKAYPGETPVFSFSPDLSGWERTISSSTCRISTTSSSTAFIWLTRATPIQAAPAASIFTGRTILQSAMSI